MMNEVTVKRMETNELNVSKRTVTYDIYVNGAYHSTKNDVIEAEDEAVLLRRTNWDMAQDAEVLMKTVAGLLSKTNKDPIVRAKLQNLLNVLEDLGETVEEN